MHQNTSQDYSNICSPEKLVNENPDLFTQGQLNWLLKTRHQNGLTDTGAILKVSQKLYIDKSKFFDWFQNQKAN